ncbi:Mycothiol acetyltransferase [Novipirellula aureliae]|uniref:Mycothiol acetyltransferase n=1 Tax=Novipirellula aureliae TaxID=2527966 RepID=A0A5C6E361_9BACT|nr:GNAT family N-acetyltransferase [Novipirellula aureliae]TWU41589.1 Mycothiol acetyltransferase [Novipirellula aureliae]
MSTIQTRRMTLDSLPGLLPKLLQNISIARGQIVVDQLRHWIDDGNAEGILIILASYRDQDESEERDIAAAVVIAPAIPQAVKGAAPANDAATLLHAAWLVERDRLPDSVRRDTAIAIQTRLDLTLAKRGIRFLQWASDVDDLSEAAEQTESWRDALGFEWAADLDYLTVDFDTISPPPTSASSPNTKLAFQQTEWDGGLLVNEDHFASLVERTYVDTLDCPILLHYRSAKQTLLGYQQSAAFAPEAWFRLYPAKDHAKKDPVGVLILALHPAEQAGVNVAELVYMGIVPEARGGSLGRLLMNGVIETAKQLGARRLILAVDSQNVYARRVYDAFGMRCMLKETVAVKKLEVADMLGAP